MPKNDEGEFEMMLGNKQLLSVFFIVIVLLGVFFVMGYIVGRSSTPGKSELASTASGTVNPAPSPTPRSLPPREVASEPAPPTEPAPARAEPQPIVEKPRTETAEPAPVEERLANGNGATLRTRHASSRFLLASGRGEAAGR